MPRKLPSATSAVESVCITMTITANAAANASATTAVTTNSTMVTSLPLPDRAFFVSDIHDSTSGFAAGVVRPPRRHSNHGRRVRQRSDVNQPGGAVRCAR